MSPRFATEYGTPGAFYVIVSKNLMNWGFPIGPDHFRARGSFMIKRMSFKRMIWSSYRDLPDPLFFLFKDHPFISMFSHLEFFTNEDIVVASYFPNEYSYISISTLFYQEYARKALRIVG
ncbi:Protein Ycf2 [Bienertia sinuspersici]